VVGVGGVPVVATQPEDETKRYLRAVGRDVEVEEDRLDFNPAGAAVTA
jgi:hypothetical protein